MCYWRYKEHTDSATFQQQKNVQILCRSERAPPVKRNCIKTYFFHVRNRIKVDGETQFFQHFNCFLYSSDKGPKAGQILID